MRKLHRYTQEQKDYIRDICEGKTVEEIQCLFNQKFNTNVTIKSIKGIMYRNGYKNKMQGYNTRFKKGHTPFNKGMKGVAFGGKETRFEKGNTNQRLPIGSETIKEGRVFIKTANPDVWEEKHRWLWKEKYGEIPDGYVIRFKDGNKKNVTIENLFMTTQRAMTSVVRRKLEHEQPELNFTIHKLAELELAIKDAVNNKR